MRALAALLEAATRLPTTLSLSAPLTPSPSLPVCSTTPVVLPLYHVSHVCVCPALPCLALPCPARLTVPRLASACCAGKGSPAVTRSVRITRHATSAVTACMVPRPGYADRS